MIRFLFLYVFSSGGMAKPNWFVGFIRNNWLLKGIFIFPKVEMELQLELIFDPNPKTLKNSRILGVIFEICQWYA
jgi:hypothetical protein